MKLATRIAWIMLAVSVVAFLVAVGWATLGRALGQEWSSLDGPEPVWPAVVGFSAPYLFALSLVTLAVLGGIRLATRRTRAAQQVGSTSAS
ncbi:hypothetical protein [Curtobacterium sp. 1544]|uniref:hypothetical protein n=1 Tax=Curtobacterium sp. 1544 TaxID=3156417 RepID=UPI0033919F4D